MNGQKTYKGRVLETGLETVRRLNQLHFILVLVQSQQWAHVLFTFSQTFNNGHVEPDVSLKVIHEPGKKREMKRQQTRQTFPQ